MTVKFDTAVTSLSNIVQEAMEQAIPCGLIPKSNLETMLTHFPNMFNQYIIVLVQGSSPPFITFRISVFSSCFRFGYFYAFNRLKASKSLGLNNIPGFGLKGSDIWAVLLAWLSGLSRSLPTCICFPWRLTASRSPPSNSWHGNLTCFPQTNPFHSAFCKVGTCYSCFLQTVCKILFWSEYGRDAVHRSFENSVIWLVLAGRLWSLNYDRSFVDMYLLILPSCRLLWAVSNLTQYTFSLFVPCSWNSSACHCAGDGHLSF
jgi:hypothetical protein